MDRVSEAREILTALGHASTPRSKLPPFVLLALCGLRPTDRWAKATRPSLGIVKGIIAFIRKEDGHPVAENTRESIRKYILKPLIERGVVEQNPGNPATDTNSQLNSYSLTASALEVVRRFGSTGWQGQLDRFKESQPKIGRIGTIRRRRSGVPVQLPNGQLKLIAPGDHNLLIAAVVEELIPCFFPKAQVLYLSDQAKKDFHFEADKLKKLGIVVAVNDALPDLILHDPQSKTVIFVEAVTSVGPISDPRLRQLEELASGCKLGKLFITAFLDFKTFGRFAGQIAWDTEIWVEERPDHLIHFNGNAFLRPRQ